MLVLQTSITGTNFDGTTGRGFVILASQNPGQENDNERAEILSVAVQSTVTQTKIEAVVAPSLADYLQGTFISLGALADTNSYNSSCCRCIVPRGWFMYVFTTGSTAGQRRLIVDWHRVTLKGEA